jgi:hypothetical protein
LHINLFEGLVLEQVQEFVVEQEFLTSQFFQKYMHPQPYHIP